MTDVVAEADLATVCADCGSARPLRARGLCSRCYVRLRRREDPARAERDRETSRAWKAQNRERTRAYDHEYRATHRDVCSVCGGDRPSDSSGSGDVCAGCLSDQVRQRRERTAELWRDGATMREIADWLGWTKAHLAGEMHRMREAGWDLPFRRAEDLSGRRVGRWLVLERAANDERGAVRWFCRCDCGTERSVDGGRLRQGETRSCGCRTGNQWRGKSDPRPGAPYDAGKGSAGA